MTTTTVKSIGSGRDYSTVQLWDDAAAADLTATDEIWKGEVYDELTVSANTLIDGATTDATRYKWLAAAASVSFADSSIALAYTTGKAGMTGSMGSGVTMFTVSDDFTLIERLQFRQSGTAGPPGFVVNVTAKSCVIRSNIVDQNGNNAAVTVSSSASGATNDVVNNAIVTRGTLTCIGINNSGSKTVHAIGNTLLNLGAGSNESKGITQSTQQDGFEPVPGHQLGHAGLTRGNQR